MASELHIIILYYLIHLTVSSCNYYEDGTTRYPLGICTGTHYFNSDHETETQSESAMMLCSSDNSHIIQYSYSASARCTGEYVTSVVSTNQDDFVCGATQTCPYVVVKVHDPEQDDNENRKWSSSARITDQCSNSEVYSCVDNTGYVVKRFEDNVCSGSPVKTTVYSASEYVETGNTKYYDVYCNQPDPIMSILTLPDEGPTAIESAVCLHGRIAGQHKEIADEMVNYCFAGYNAKNKPIYKGQYAEIRWTKVAGESYGESFGLFVYGTEDEPADGFPIAHCFRDDITACSQNWYVEHGSSPRYYLDESMKVMECECDIEIAGAEDEAMTAQHESGVMWSYDRLYAVFFIGFITMYFE